MIKGTNKFVLETFKLPIMVDIHSFSNIIGLNPSLVFVLSQNTTKYYKKHIIPKRDGSTRLIFEPSYSLKLVQRWLLEEILYNIPVSNYTFGFMKGSSNPLRLNAAMHKDNIFIFKMDMKNFFPSIKKDKIYFLFNEVGYNPTMANILANLCTLDGMLPQGAVTSPCLANLVCRHLDKRISKYCEKREITYTRYADDLTFSCNSKAHLKSIFPVIKTIINSEGFELNEKKTRFLTPKVRKTVTGITLSGGELKAPKEMKQKVRAMIHKMIVTGDYTKASKVKGYIAYISSIESEYLFKIKSYIQSFEKKPIIIHKECVDAFNSNKLFKDLTDFTLLKSSDFVEFSEEFSFDEYNYSERIDYLEKLGIKTEKEPHYISEDNLKSSDEFPF